MVTLVLDVKLSRLQEKWSSSENTVDTSLPLQYRRPILFLYMAERLLRGLGLSLKFNYLFFLREARGLHSSSSREVPTINHGAAHAGIATGCAPRTIVFLGVIGVGGKEVVALEFLRLGSL